MFICCFLLTHISSSGDLIRVKQSASDAAAWGDFTTAKLPEKTYLGIINTTFQINNPENYIIKYGMFNNLNVGAIVITVISQNQNYIMFSKCSFTNLKTSNAAMQIKGNLSILFYKSCADNINPSAYSAPEGILIASNQCKMLNLNLTTITACGPLSDIFKGNTGIYCFKTSIKFNALNFTRNEAYKFTFFDIITAEGNVSFSIIDSNNADKLGIIAQVSSYINYGYLNILNNTVVNGNIFYNETPEKPSRFFNVYFSFEYTFSSDSYIVDTDLDAQIDDLPRYLTKCGITTSTPNITDMPILNFVRRNRYLAGI